MSKHLERDLEGLERRMLFLAGEVEEAVRRSIRALLDRRIELAERVIDGDDEIDRREVELEEECLKVLALHNPVASDLRFIVACLKIENDLERIADLAANIAERSVSFSTRSVIPVPNRIREMVENCARMLRQSIESFVRGDAQLARRICEEDTQLARRICEEDTQIDRANRLIIQELIEAMHSDPTCIDQAVELISVSKNLERIGDHATNIAEDVVYLVEGDIIRHQKQKQR
jgi:phosphate transport system protein